MKVQFTHSVKYWLIIEVSFRIYLLVSFIRPGFCSVAFTGLKKSSRVLFRRTSALRGLSVPKFSSIHQFTISHPFGRRLGVSSDIRTNTTKCLAQQQVQPTLGHLAVPPARRWPPELQAPQSDREKLPAVAHAAAVGAQAQQALAVCGVSTLKTRRVSKSVLYQCW